MGGGFDTLSTGLTFITVLGGGLALWLLVGALARLARGRLLAGGGRLLLALVFALSAALGASIGLNLRTWQRLTHEAPVADLTQTALGDQRYRVELQFADGKQEVVELRGDEWQLDARLLKWSGFATVLGFDTLWRAERISGRWQDIERERSEPRSVHALGDSAGLDLWVLARQHRWLPWVDAVYGSATYLPMADGARWQVTVSGSGLVARPLNAAAERALTDWR